MLFNKSIIWWIIYITIWSWHTRVIVWHFSFGKIEVDLLETIGSSPKVMITLDLITLNKNLGYCK